VYQLTIQDSKKENFYVKVSGEDNVSVKIIDEFTLKS